MLTKRPPDIKGSEITDEGFYMNRRQFIATTLAITGFASTLSSTSDAGEKLPTIKRGLSLQVVSRGGFSTDEKPTSYKDATSYNNFYEFSTSKEGIAELARSLRTRPWTVTVEGHVKRPKVYDIDELLRMFPLEERVYRFRCVEGWSAVIPWVGFPLGEFIKRCEPLSSAKYVEFITLHRPDEMPGQKTNVLEWPYLEGLRMDEATHPLTLMAVGMYGEVLPNQNGAPLRLVVPWKYGFKNTKSIVRIRFVEDMPVTAWMKASPKEYGFYANVNPHVHHPRWSQAKERRLGELSKRDTLLFNGYGEEVGHLYTGMDLKRFF
ncbi:MAG: protein-methionine-sulfoxide reductase catalytic subunit MsrP [Deltaproteobacteria bacterium]|nr:protein-methionine-sulfoxide reductase catalytic subunit MsrP [Deltaproteobacteria bacterium]